VRAQLLPGMVQILPGYKKPQASLCPVTNAAQPGHSSAWQGVLGILDSSPVLEIGPRKREGR